MNHKNLSSVSCDDFLSELPSKKQESLHAWVINYLKNEGSNLKLAQILEAKGVKPTLSKQKIEPLIRIMGPEANITFPEALGKWERRVKEIENRIAKGWIPEPLIVANYWGKHTIADGNHRHEALKRMGIKEYLVITYTK